MNKLYIKIRNTKLVRAIVRGMRRIILPGFDRVPLYDVFVFFVRGLMNGAITTRGSSVAFKFFMALFPAIIFLFTIIPYIPVDNLQSTLMDTIREILPANFYGVINETINDILTQPHGGLLSIGFVLAVYFASNGILGIITAFNSTTHDIENRSIVIQYLISFLLVIILSVILIFALSVIVGFSALLNYLNNNQMEEGSFVYYTLITGKWLVVVFMLFFAVSFLYYLAPARKTRFRFISAGSTLATLLFIMTSLGFNYYVDHFATYNAVYGSIGTFIVIMMWMYINALVLIIGFELNASIANARMQKSDILLPERK